MAQYLFGAAVQGIQQFIFQTNALKDIIGRSDIVEQICTDLFVSVLSKGPDYKAESDPNFIVHAAGNVKYVFDSEDECRRVVRSFPKTVMEQAPGITVSQAVVPLTGDFGADVDLLETRLRIQRNRPLAYGSAGMCAIRRNARTGFPALLKPGFPDEGSFQAASHYDAKALCLKAFGQDVDSKRFPYNIDSMTGQNDWVAVIHADGNGLGQIIQRIGHNREELRTFSIALDHHTAAAARSAYETVRKEFGFDELKTIPIRPIVLSGDDFTAICRADIAVEYAKAFMDSFERETGLTACAGISFVKSSFPFSFAYTLAEELCSAAKADAKADEAVRSGRVLPPSCLLFHKVQDSTVEDFEQIKARELMPAEGYSLCFGPYYLHKKSQRWTVDQLEDAVFKLDGRNGNIAKTALRRWLSAINVDPEMAKQLIVRACAVNKQLEQFLTTMTSPGSRGSVPTYDVLAFHTILNQKTR